MFSCPFFSPPSFDCLPLLSSSKPFLFSQCINIETSRLVDANEKDERPHVDMGAGLGDGLRDRTNEMFGSFQPSQLSELADLLRTVLHDARQTSQRLTNIEQMMETLKGGGDCGLDNLSEHSGEGKSIIE